MTVIKSRSTAATIRLQGALLAMAGLCVTSIHAADGPEPRTFGTLRSEVAEKGGPSKEQDLFRGTWKCSRFEADGREVPFKADDPAQNPYWKVVFDGDLFKFVAEDGKVMEPLFKVSWSPSSAPKQFDLHGIPREESLAGIYKLDGDTLTICLTIDKNSPIRPTRFATKEGLPLMLFVFQREKDALAPPPAGNSR